MTRIAVLPLVVRADRWWRAVVSARDPICPRGHSYQPRWIGGVTPDGVMVYVCQHGDPSGRRRVPCGIGVFAYQLPDDSAGQRSWLIARIPDDEVKGVERNYWRWPLNVLLKRFGIDEDGEAGVVTIFPTSQGMRAE